MSISHQAVGASTPGTSSALAFGLALPFAAGGSLEMAFEKLCSSCLLGLCYWLCACVVVIVSFLVPMKNNGQLDRFHGTIVAGHSSIAFPQSSINLPCNIRFGLKNLRVQPLCIKNFQFLLAVLQSLWPQCQFAWEAILQSGGPGAR